MAWVRSGEMSLGDGTIEADQGEGGAWEAGPGPRGGASAEGAGLVPARAVAGVAGAAAGSRTSAGRTPLARLGGIAERARVGPGGEETAPEEPAERHQGCPRCLASNSASSLWRRNWALTGE